MKLRIKSICFLLIISSLSWAAAPTGYYTNANGKNTSALRTALESIISNGTTDVGYGGLWTAYSTTDMNASGKIWDMYSNCSFTFSTTQCGTYSAECDCYNREHTSPQSWFGQAAPMVSDLFNVYPTDGKVNGYRSNYPYGEVGTASYTSANGCKLGTSSFAGYADIVFEPIDEYKGDFARTYFYMATRYASVCQNWASGAEVVYGSNLGLTTYAMNLFLKWSRQDPVSTKETLRNEAVYSIQNNRNPFIDYPGLEEYIWGNNTSGVFSSSGVTLPTINTPSSSNVTTNSAILGGNISATGNGTITQSGIYYSTTNGFANGTGTKATASATTTGAFTTYVGSLNSGTNYYFKAFATNSAGTAYSTQGTFTTGSVSGPTIFATNQIGTGSTLAYGKVNGSVNKILLIKASALTGNLTVNVTGSMFSTPTTTITKAEAEAGYNVTITYNPTAIGSHTGSLNITGGGLTNYSVSLTGSK
jgi:endonuclease I